MTTKAHLATVNVRIAELERAVGTFKTDSGSPKSPAKGRGNSSTGGGDSAADIEQRLVGLFKEKWAGAAAER